MAAFVHNVSQRSGDLRELVLKVEAGEELHALGAHL